MSIVLVVVVSVAVFGILLYAARKRDLKTRKITAARIVENYVPGTIWALYDDPFDQDTVAKIVDVKENSKGVMYVQYKYVFSNGNSSRTRLSMPLSTFAEVYSFRPAKAI